MEVSTPPPRGVTSSTVISWFTDTASQVPTVYCLYAAGCGGDGVVPFWRPENHLFAFHYLAILPRMASAIGLIPVPDDSPAARLLTEYDTGHNSFISHLDRAPVFAKRYVFQNGWI